MATFISIRTSSILNGAFEQIQKQPRFNCTARKSEFSLAICALLPILAITMAQTVNAQSTDTDASTVTISASTANLIRWSGSLPQAAGRTVEMLFSIYQNPAGGSALWSETQPVKVGTDGRYSVLLGATSADGLPQTLFQASEAQWIEARPVQQLNSLTSGETILEAANASTISARSQLTAVPYAFKSVDADTLAGRAASDYVTREDLQSTVANQVHAISSTKTLLSNAANPLFNGVAALNNVGTSGFLPMWTASATLGDSMVAQSGTNVGIGTNAPATMLDVNGASTLRGSVSLLATAATLAAGTSSPALQLGASAYSSTSHAAVQQNFVWQATSTGNNTDTPSANLNLLFGAGQTAPAATGLSINPSGHINFAPGQTFPGAGTGTITGISTGPGLTGGGSSGNVTVAFAGPISTANGGTGAASPAAALANLGGISSTQTAPQTVAGPLTGTNFNIKFLNGIPQADQFDGADFCVKLRAANVWALANNYKLVDATHFPSRVTCSIDPLANLNSPGNTTALTVELPASLISTSVPWLMNNSGLVLRGKGRFQTILMFTGTASYPSIVTLGGSPTNAYFTNYQVISDMSIVGGLAASTGAIRDAVLTQADGGFTLDNISTWGVTGCGIHTQFAVTLTIIRPHTFSDEAIRASYYKGYRQPTSGLCFDQTNNGDTTTDGTVIDPIATGVSGPGFNYIAAQGITMTGGTSEGNGSGINLSTKTNAAAFNTFINTDLEANTANSAGVDINDSGYGNKYINVLALSACKSCSSVNSASTYIPNYFDGGIRNTGISGSGWASSSPSAWGGYSFSPGMTIESDKIANGTPFSIFTPNVTGGNNIQMSIGPDRYATTPYQDAILGLNYYSSGNKGNSLHLGMQGGAQMYITGASAFISAPFSATTLSSNVATGTAPLTVTSTTPVANLTLSSISQVVGLNQKLNALAPVGSPAFNGLATFAGGTTSAAYKTLTVCSSTTSPAACGSATAGRVQIKASSTSLVINSSAFTSSTGCWFTYDISGIYAPTNVAVLFPPYISARSAGKSITINLPVAPLSNPVNVQFGCVN